MIRRVALALALSAMVCGLLPFSAPARDAVYPARADRAINDFAGMLNPKTASRLEGFSRALREKTGDAVVVVTVKSIDPETVEGYAVRLFERWGIGEKGKDNGLLILVAEQERKTRIEVGYGLEGVIPDADASRIIRQLMLPNFRQGDYNRGVDLAVQAVIGKIAAERGLEIEGLDKKAAAAAESGGKSGNPVVFIVFVFIIFFPLIRVLTYRATGKGRRTGAGGFWAGYGGSGGGRGGFSGGFGGFGGGMSGGGGASGGW
jgi:uncharacterized protein